MNTPERAREHLAAIRDPIGFAGAALGGRRVDDREECVSFLLEQLVRLAYRYDIDQDKDRDFLTFAFTRLRRFGVADYLRATRGRTTWRFSTHTHERELALVYSLDADDGDGGRLGAAVAAGAGDLRLIAIPHMEGWSLLEIAAELKTSKSLVSRLLRELARELRRLAA